jgi:hypothetical protein
MDLLQIGMFFFRNQVDYDKTQAMTISTRHTKRFDNPRIMIMGVNYSQLYWPISVNSEAGFSLIMIKSTGNETDDQRG